ncbi:MAG: hypothetical protein GY861_14740 [bacterium]|nr:hypothetical protein [bacterium]
MSDNYNYAPVRQWPMGNQVAMSPAWIKYFQLQNDKLNDGRKLDIAGDSGSGDVDLADEVLTIAGTTNRVTTSASSQTITLTLPQDIHTGATPTFAGLNLGTGELTCGSINRTTGTLTIETGGSAQISIDSTGNATFAEDIVITGGKEIRTTVAGDYIQFDADGFIAVLNDNDRNLISTSDGDSDVIIFANSTDNQASVFQGTGGVTFEGNIIIPDSGTIGSASDTDAITIASSGNVNLSNSLTLAKGSQNYLVTDRGNRLVLKGKSAGTAMGLELFTQDGDGTDVLDISLWGVGDHTDVTNRERLIVQYSKNNLEYSISTEADGTGTLRPLVLFTEGNTNQVKLNIDGSTSFGGNAIIPSDSNALIVGAGSDAKFWYDGTDARITTDAVAASDLIVDCGTNKTMELAEAVWDDLRTPINAVKKVSGKEPTETAYKGGLVYSFSKTSDNSIVFNVQVPHEYKLGTDIEFHVHYIIPTAGSGVGAENIKWDFTHSWAKIGSAQPNETTVNTTIDVQSLSANTHYLGEIAATIDGSAIDGVSSMLICSLTRDTSVANDYDDVVYLMEVDFHYQIDTMGSRQEAVK